MKRSHIPVCIDLLFCLVIMPPIIMLVPVDKWMVHHSAFMLTLITYLYGLYFVYRKTKLPLLFMQRKFGRILLMIALLVGVTFLLTHFPYLAEPENIDPFLLKTWRHLRSQMVWFFFLIVTGFSLSIELIFELFHQVLSRQETEAEKNKAQLALYKAQINPHFLFNTLNTLYRTGTHPVGQDRIRFCEVLRYLEIYVYPNCFRGHSRQPRNGIHPPVCRFAVATTQSAFASKARNVDRRRTGGDPSHDSDYLRGKYFQNTVSLPTQIASFFCTSP
ncbi:Predicted signal transduction protein with a C-terminal ATPase domain [Parabacteroides distasonis]|uniref:Predicted signal transduction protein with a C-terminal ATPase domain n=1 Tax=Parabacteroides distasonis TaxID=823 RepID=A0A174QN09_PARDI|nr:Predicted signal transduction protein with a C-terminal ATPase domain [Parabacteroides distasonis]